MLFIKHILFRTCRKGIISFWFGAKTIIVFRMVDMKLCETILMISICVFFTDTSKQIIRGWAVAGAPDLQVSRVIHPT